MTTQRFAIALLMVALIGADALAASATTSTIEGIVVTVSADSLIDKRSGEPFYVAQIKIDDHEILKLGEAKLRSGMLAEVMIRTGVRSMSDYLLEPLLRTLRRAMRES